MAQAYSDPARESDPHALPDLEIFHLTQGEADSMFGRDEAGAGWFYWYCFPGCMPDGELPFGPYDSAAAALAAARDERED